MCFFKTPSMPAVPAPVQNPTEQDTAVQASLDAERRRRAAAAGQSSTLLTGGAGLTGATPSTGKSLLGQ